ncbi:alpha/beta hydrolase [Thermodesulfobacteriota bacterium]
MLKTILITASGFCVLIATAFFFLVHKWSNTPYGKLDPYLAVPFKLLELIDGSSKKTDKEILDEFYDPASMNKMRKDVQNGAFLTSKKADFSGKTIDKKISTDETDIPIRIYTPKGDGPFPLLVYFHGGGFAFGNIAFADNVCKSISEKASIIVLSADYRLAPEHPFPAGLTDACSVVTWATKNMEAINAMPGKIAVAGDSSGGNLAAAISHKFSDDNKELIGLQVLIYPVLNLSNLNTNSYNCFAEGYGLTRRQMSHLIKVYIKNQSDLKNPYISPLLDENFNNLPPTLIISAEFDPLRDEGELYSKKLKESGIPVDYIRYNTMAHGFITANRLVSEAEDAIDDIVRGIQRYL